MMQYASETFVSLAFFYTVDYHCFSQGRKNKLKKNVQIV